MSQRSRIEWTDATWNPTTGCTKISQGCKNCYAETMARRLKAMGNARYRAGFALTLHEDLLDTPLRWKKPRRIFVNSMSDLFHEDVPVTFLKRVFSTMRDCPWHRFQVLTKRSRRLRELAAELSWPANVWVGVSVENQDASARVEDLRTVPSSVRFLSLEPLLEDIGRLDLRGISWVIAGGESGPRARPVDPAWIRSIRDQCVENRVPFFFKQWGGVQKKATGRRLDGRTWDQLPGPSTARRTRAMGRFSAPPAEVAGP